MLLNGITVPFKKTSNFLGIYDDRTLNVGRQVDKGDFMVQLYSKLLLLSVSSVASGTKHTCGKCSLLFSCQPWYGHSRLRQA